MKICVHRNNRSSKMPPKATLLSSTLRGEEIMDIRKEIETLAIWYIPAFLITVLLSAAAAGYFKAFFMNLKVTSFTKFSFVTYISLFIGLTDNLVVAVWLYFQNKKECGKKVLWMIFGLFAHLPAAIIYIGLKVLEDMRASNQPLISEDSKSETSSLPC